MKRALIAVIVFGLWWNVAALTLLQPTGILRYTVFAPAAVAYGRVISYAGVAKIAQAIRSTEEGISRHAAMERALQFQVRDSATRAVLRRAHQDVTPDDVDIVIDQNFLTATGWSEEEYRTIVGGALTRRERASHAVLTDDAGRTTAEGTLLPLREQIVTDGMPFAGAAEIFSEDASAPQGGDLGTEPADWMAPVTTLAPGEITNVIAGPDAYWLLTRSQGRIRGIAVKKPTLDQVLTQMAKEKPPFVLLW